MPKVTMYPNQVTWFKMEASDSTNPWSVHNDIFQFVYMHYDPIAGMKKGLCPWFTPAHIRVWSTGPEMETWKYLVTGLWAVLVQ